jgi:hypothetical protein
VDTAQIAPDGGQRQALRGAQKPDQAGQAHPDTSPPRHLPAQGQVADGASADRPGRSV